MSSFYLRNHLQSLHQQISHSVDKIKQHSSQTDFSTDLTQDTEKSFCSNHYRIEGQAYQLLSVEVNWSLQNHLNIEDNASQYASSSYIQAKNVLQEPTILIDFMFPNNKEFDFKV